MVNDNEYNLTTTMPTKIKEANMSERSRKSTVENPSRLSQFKEQQSKSSQDAKDQFVRIGLKGHNIIQHN
jgi:hypothetical protein